MSRGAKGDAASGKEDSPSSGATSAQPSSASPDAPSTDDNVSWEDVLHNLSMDFCDGGAGSLPVATGGASKHELHLTGLIPGHPASLGFLGPQGSTCPQVLRPATF